MQNSPQIISIYYSKWQLKQYFLSNSPKEKCYESNK